MKKIYYIATLIVLLLVGCNDDFVDLQSAEGAKTLKVAVSVPDNDTGKLKKRIDQNVGSKDIIVKWEQGNTIDLFFEQGSMLKLVKEIPLTNITNNGKKAQFEVKVPVGIDASKAYTLYGAYGCLTQIKNSKPITDVLMKTTWESDFEVPMYFKQTINGNVPNIMFKHMGAMLVYRTYNKDRRLDVKVPVIKPMGSESDYPFYIGNDHAFDLRAEQVIATPNITNLDFWELVTTKVFPAVPAMPQKTVQWVVPKNISGTKPAMVYFGGEDMLAANIFARNMQVGKAYHLKLTVRNNELTVQGTEATTPSRMTLKTNKDKIELNLYANPNDQGNCWIDLNANSKRDQNEKIYFGQDHEYQITNNYGAVTIYGKVTNLEVGYNQQVTNLVVKNNLNLSYLYVGSNPITELDLSKNVNLESLLFNNLSDDNDVSKKLSTLDVSKNKKLTKILLNYVNINKLNLTNNKELIYFQCYDGTLKELDISANKKVQYVNVVKNKLTKLNVANGNNKNFQGLGSGPTKFIAKNNPSLTCIKVDKDFVPDSNWKKDTTTAWNNTDRACGPGKLVFKKNNSENLTSPTDRINAHHLYKSEGSKILAVEVENIGFTPVTIKEVKTYIQNNSSLKLASYSFPTTSIRAGEIKTIKLRVSTMGSTDYNREWHNWNVKIKTEEGQELKYQCYVRLDESLKGKVTNVVYNVVSSSQKKITIFGKDYYYKPEYVDTDKDDIISIREAKEYEGTLILWLADWGNSDKNPFKYFTNITTLSAIFVADWQSLKFLKNLKRLHVDGPYEHLAKALWRNGKAGIAKVEEMKFYVTDDGNNDYGTLDKDEFPSLKKWWSHGYRYPNHALQPQLTHYHIDGSPMKSTGSVKLMTSLESLMIKDCPRLKKFYLPKNYKGSGITIEVEDCPIINTVYVANGYTPTSQEMKNWGIQNASNVNIIHY